MKKLFSPMPKPLQIPYIYTWWPFRETLQSECFCDFRQICFSRGDHVGIGSWRCFRGGVNCGVHAFFLGWGVEGEMRDPRGPKWKIAQHSVSAVDVKIIGLGYPRATGKRRVLGWHVDNFDRHVMKNEASVGPWKKLAIISPLSFLKKLCYGYRPAVLGGTVDMGRHVGKLDGMW